MLEAGFVLLANAVTFVAATVAARGAALRQIQGLMDKHNELAMAYYALKDYVNWAVTQRAEVRGKVIQLPLRGDGPPPRDWPPRK